MIVFRSLKGVSQVNNICVDPATVNCCNRMSTGNIIKYKARRLRDKADRLDLLLKELSNLSNDAEETLWEIISTSKFMIGE